VIDIKRPDQPSPSEQAEFERLTIDAILEHRRLLAAAEISDEALRQAELGPRLCPERHAALEDANAEARQRLSAQQLVLNSLINRLGYVPEVPPVGSSRGSIN